MRPNRGSLVVALSALAPLAFAAPPQVAPRLDDAELTELADELARYLEARRAGTGLDEARSAVATELNELAGADSLRRSGDLGRALWLARGYDEQRAKTGKVEDAVFAEGSFTAAEANGVGGLAVAYRLPKGYDPRGAGYPLLLAIPGRDEDPAQHLRADWTHAPLLDGAILLCPAMPADAETWSQVSVNGRPAGLCNVLTALRVGVERFAADPDRIFVAGKGAGVPAAVAAGNYAPQLFAGVIGVGGEPDPIEPETSAGPANFRNLPTLFVGGGARAHDFQKAAVAAGFESCELAPKGGEEDVWRWVEPRRRDATPHSITLVVGKPFPTRIGWLRVAPSAPDAQATAVIEREANTIRVDGSGVTHATLYLNDELIDLSKPVTVVCNGVVTKSEFKRDLSTFLDLAVDGTSDAGCVYVVEARFDMSGEELAREDASRAHADPEDVTAILEAGDDVAKLRALHERFRADEAERAAAIALRRIVRADPDDAEARAALGHVRLDERWFSSEARRDRFQSRQGEAAAKDRGFVKHKGVWMHTEDRALAGKGQVRDEATGLWSGADDRRRLAEGWVRQDLAWVEPDESVLVDDGLWRVDGEWYDRAVANRRHARVDSMWCIPTPEVLVYATADREVALRAADVMARAIDDLQKVFGLEPQLPLPVCVLRDEEQYDRFAFGDPDGRRPPTHAGRLHVIHTAFFAESWLPRVDGEREFRGMGVCYWDPLVPYGDLYGVHAARLAVGLSYVDAIDPSPKAVRRGISKGPGPEHYAEYQAEKALPAWLRTGGAVYAERYFRDDTVAEDGDPWWARAWSLGNLSSRGGLRPLPEVFAFALDADDRLDGLKLYIESGLLVAFLVDGGCAPAEEALAAFRAALVAGRLKPSHVRALEDALVEHESELRAFAGL